MNKLTIKLLMTWAMVYGLASLGALIKKHNPQMFDMYELIGVIFVPIMYIFFGMYLQSVIVDCVEPKNKLKFTLCSWCSIFTGAALHFLSVIAFSPGVPEDFAGGLINMLYLLMAIFAVFSVLAKNQIYSTDIQESE